MNPKCSNCPNSGPCFIKCTPIKVRTKTINQRTEKRAKQEQEYSKKKKLFLMANPNCQFQDCKCKSVDVHHKKGRTGSLLTDLEYFMAVCRNHHNFIELNPKLAYEQGYSIHR